MSSDPLKMRVLSLHIPILILIVSSMVMTDGLMTSRIFCVDALCHIFCSALGFSTGFCDVKNDCKCVTTPTPLCDPQLCIGFCLQNGFPDGVCDPLGECICAPPLVNLGPLAPLEASRRTCNDTCANFCTAKGFNSGVCDPSDSGRCSCES